MYIVNDDQIVEKIIQFQSMSPSYIQRKYNLSYKRAKELFERWENHVFPREKTFEEKLAEFKKNYIPKKTPPQKRHTPFYLNGKMLDTWEEAREELKLIRKAKHG